MKLAKWSGIGLFGKVAKNFVFSKKAINYHILSKLQ
jgi:hypothetical protein